MSQTHQPGQPSSQPPPKGQIQSRAPAPSQSEPSPSLLGAAAPLGPSSSTISYRHTSSSLLPSSLGLDSTLSVISPPVSARAQLISPPSSSPTPGVQKSSGAAARANINQPPPLSVQNKKQKVTEKICARYPHLSEDQAAQYILKLNQSNNGVLSGLSPQEIFQGVEQLMRLDSSEEQETRESECSICMEDMQPGAPNVRTLPCSHSFHNSCINVSNHCIVTQTLTCV